jgi:hypothetical protein
LSKKKLEAVSTLRNDESVVILPADKGKSTVVMDRDEYRKKIGELLNDESYKPLKKDPTLKLERVITSTLEQAEKDREVHNKQRLKLTPQHSNPPQLYGLPKLHKVGIPLHPRVSSIGSATYPLAQDLARVLAPLRGKTTSYIKNSSHFVAKIQSLSLSETGQL